MGDKFLCPGCGTDLSARQLIGGNCPQCGRDLTVKLGYRKSRHPGIVPPEGGLFETERETGPVEDREVKPR